MIEYHSLTSSGSPMKERPELAKPPKRPEPTTQTNEEILSLLTSMLREVAQQMQNLQAFLERLPGVEKEEPKSFGQVAYEALDICYQTPWKWEALITQRKEAWQKVGDAVVKHYVENHT